MRRLVSRAQAVWRSVWRSAEVDADMQDEMRLHLDLETERLVREHALPPDEARRRAHVAFGGITKYQEASRDGRGTAFIEGCLRDVFYAFRTFQRAPLTALTIVVTVALGLGAVAVVFTVLNAVLFRVDDVVRPGELFAVERPRHGDSERVRFTRPQYEALRRETGVFTDAFAMLGDIESRIDGRMMSATLVTGNFFQVLGVEAALGRALTPADDERFAGEPIAVLSHSGWLSHFAGDPAVIGRTMTVNGVRCVIVGVMPDGFRGLSVGAPDLWAPLAMLGHFRPIHAGRENLVGLEIIGRLKPGLSRGRALAELLVWDSGLREGRAAAGREARITLVPSQGTLARPMEAVAVTTPLFIAFGLILLIGCANVANLLLALGVSRQREIGIRLALGASRRRITRQLLTENLLLALAAAALGLVISQLALETTIYAVMTTMPPDLAENVRLAVPAADWRVALFMVGGAAVATALFGLAPALQATRLELVRTIRGEVVRDSRPGRARQLLIGTQVTAATLLLIGSAVFLRSAFAASTEDPGIRTADTVFVDIINEPLRGAMVEAVRAEPLVAAIAAARPDAMARPREAFAEAAEDPSRRRLSLAYRFVSPEYFSVLDIEVIRGRGFSNAERRADAAVVVVAESVARELWPGGNAVGQILHLDNDPNSETRRIDEAPLPVRAFTVVGIARDVAGFRLAGFKEAELYLPTSPAEAETSLMVRVHGDPDQARRALLQRLTVVDSNMGQVMAMKTLAGMGAYILSAAFWLTLVLGGLALVLTLSGLFSVLSYLVEQRAKEIGVRMALGATTGNVGRMVLSQTLPPIGFGLVAGGTLAAALGTAIMATPAAAVIDGFVRVFDPVAYAASLLCIVVACALAALVPAVRAARIDPIETLRQD